MAPCAFTDDIVCIVEPYNAAVERVSMYVVLGPDGRPVGPNEDAIAELGVRISTLFSDAILERRPQGMSQKCLNGVCVYYVRACKPDKLTCRFVVAAALQADLNFTFEPREFEIEARSVDSKRAAEAAIRIGLPTAPDIISVADLQDESSADLLGKFSAWSWN